MKRRKGEAKGQGDGRLLVMTNILGTKPYAKPMRLIDTTRIFLTTLSQTTSRKVALIQVLLADLD